MKKGFLSLLFALCVSVSFGQYSFDWFNLNFDDSLGKSHLILDSIHNSNNLWQIGKPQKNPLSSAFSFPNVIITDTINSYPINDTSFFETVSVNIYPPNFYYYINLSGYYFVNSDTITDFGKIEFSPDNGVSWYDMLKDTTFTPFMWTDKPVLSGNSYGWKPFHVEIQPFYYNNIQIDTFRFRFTFISDSIQTNKDGLMFDNLHSFEWFEGINKLQNNNLISVYPNPVNNELVIHKEKNVYDKISVEIFDLSGRNIYRNSNYKEASINTSELADGTYMLKYYDSKNFAAKKFMVQHK